MSVSFSFEGRAERLIAAGRVVLASFSLLAIWLDPSEPAKYAALAYSILAAYVLYALIVLLLVWTSFAPLIRLRLITHILDLAFFSVLMYLTEGPASPFFVYLIFSLVCATVRWQWRGVLWTSVVSLTIFLGIGVYAAEILHDPEFELNRFIIRTVYLGVVAVLLAYLSAHEHQNRNRLAKLAAWPPHSPSRGEKIVNEILEHAAAIHGTPRVVMAWEESEEPYLHLTLFSTEGKFEWSRKPPGSFSPLVAPYLESKSFFSRDVRASVATVTDGGWPEVRRWHGEPVNQELVTLLNIKSVMSVRLSGENFQGRLFFLDKHFTSDDLVLAEVVGSHAAASLDLLTICSACNAPGEERMRLSRDLHDGVLQSLTVAGLRLRAAMEVLETNPETAREQLQGIRDLIIQEQRGLRSFVESLKLATLVPSKTDFDVPRQLEYLCNTVERDWALHVELKIDGMEERLPIFLARQIYHIVREGLVNAARHSHASVARVELRVDNRQVRITVADNGRGFPFRGYYNYDALTSKGLGPAMLKSRIASLGGLLNIDSSESGAQLQITLPLSEREN